MTRLSQKQLKKLGVQPVSKYRSHKVEVDGITFDSKKEAAKYQEIVFLHKVGEVTDYILQPEFVLQEAYRDRNGKYIRAIKYRADFRVTYKDGSIVVIDTKGYKTKDYLIKRKLFMFKYPEIDFREE